MESQKNPSARLTFLDLPDCVVAYIIRKLAGSLSSTPGCSGPPSLHSDSLRICEAAAWANLKAFSSVSRQTRRVSGNPELYRHMNIRGELPRGALQWLAFRASKIETLELSGLKAADSVSAQPRLDDPKCQIQTDLPYPKPNQAEFLFADDPAKYMAGLEAVLQASSHSLRRLQLHGVSRVFSQAIFSKLARHSCNLTTIFLSENKFAGQHAGLCQIAAGCPHVEEFSICEMEEELEDKNSQLNDNTMGVLVFNWPNLKTFSVERNEVTLRGLCLLRHCPRLEKLYLGFLRELGDDFFKEAGKAEQMVLSRTLKILEFCVPSCTVTGAIRPLLLCPNLKELVISSALEWLEPDDGQLSNDDWALLKRECRELSIVERWQH